MNFYFHTHSLPLATHKAVPLIKRATQSPQPDGNKLRGKAKPSDNCRWTRQSPEKGSHPEER